MNLDGILMAENLSRADAEVLAELIDVHRQVDGRNRLLDLYYESEQPTPQIGVDNIPDCVDPHVRSDWARKAVTSVSERVKMDGFVFSEDYEDESFRRVMRLNDIDNAFNRNVASELTHGCMFATVQRQGQSVAVRMHTADTSAALWDVPNGRVAAGFVVANAARVSSGNVVPTQVNVHLPGRVIVIMRNGLNNWFAESYATPLDRPMMECFAFRPTGTKPFGQTRITRTVRYLVDEVERTLRYMAVSNAFYAIPMMAMTGLTDEMFDSMTSSKWTVRVGSWVLATRDNEGRTAEVQQFQGASPQPYIDAIQTYAKLFSGATGVPLNSLGIVQDNPSSAEAIAAAREDVCVAAEDCIETNRASMRNVALMAMAIIANKPVEELTDEQLSVMPHFKNPMMPSAAAAADSMSKVAGVLDGFSQTREFLAGVGFDSSDIESIRSQLKRIQGSEVVSKLLAKERT